MGHNGILKEISSLESRGGQKGLLGNEMESLKIPGKGGVLPSVKIKSLALDRYSVTVITVATQRTLVPVGVDGGYI